LLGLVLILASSWLESSQVSPPPGRGIAGSIGVEDSTDRVFEIRTSSRAQYLRGTQTRSLESSSIYFYRMWIEGEAGIRKIAFGSINCVNPEVARKTRSIFCQEVLVFEPGGVRLDRMTEPLLPRWPQGTGDWSIAIDYAPDPELKGWPLLEGVQLGRDEKLQYPDFALDSRDPSAPVLKHNIYNPIDGLVLNLSATLVDLDAIPGSPSPRISCPNPRILEISVRGSRQFTCSSSRLRHDLMPSPEAFVPRSDSRVQSELTQDIEGRIWCLEDLTVLREEREVTLRHRQSPIDGDAGGAYEATYVTRMVKSIVDGVPGSAPPGDR